MTKPLSPSAQAVLDAFTEDNSLHDRKHNHYNTEALAAALRAAADHVVPKTPTLSYPEDYELGVWVANDDTRTELLAIADELEGHQ